MCYSDLRRPDLWLTMKDTDEGIITKAIHKQGVVVMAGLIFTFSLLSILTTVGFLFAWMVRLASKHHEHNDASSYTSSPSISELPSESIRPTK